MKTQIKIDDVVFKIGDIFNNFDSDGKFLGQTQIESTTDYTIKFNVLFKSINFNTTRMTFKVFERSLEQKILIKK